MMPDYLGGVSGVGAELGLEAVVVGAGITAVVVTVGLPVTVCGESGPDPSGSITVVGASPGANDGLVSVGLVSVVVGVVVVDVVVVVVLGWT